MPNREIPTGIKVKVMENCLSLTNVEEVAAEYGVSPGAIYYWDKKLKSKLSDILVNHRPGPKPEVRSERKQEEREAKSDRPIVCPECGSKHIWKNGTYRVINWIWLITVGWLVGLQQVQIQRWRCAE